MLEGRGPPGSKVGGASAPAAPPVPGFMVEPEAPLERRKGVCVAGVTVVVCVRFGLFRRS